MIKELFVLVKMLFNDKPSNIKETVLMGMNHFPFKGYSYMMWCGKMIYRNDKYERRKQEWDTDCFKVTRNHENIHLLQAKMCGSWIKYYYKYLIEWLRGNPILHPSSSAYMTIPWECEAYANEENMEYCKNYNGSNVKKYTFKGRKKLYRQVGGTSSDWKAYVKSL